MSDALAPIWDDPRGAAVFSRRADVAGRLRLVFDHTQDRLAGDAFVGRECGGSFRKGQHRADDRFEPSIPHSRGEVGESRRISFDKHVQCPPVARPVLWRLGDGDQRSAGPHQSR